MGDLHAVFDSLVGYLVGMALIETVIKPALVKLTRKGLKEADKHTNDLIPDWLYEEEEVE